MRLSPGEKDGGRAWHLPQAPPSVGVTWALRLPSCLPPCSVLYGACTPCPVLCPRGVHQGHAGLSNPSQIGELMLITFKKSVFLGS